MSITTPPSFMTRLYELLYAWIGQKLGKSSKGLPVIPEELRKTAKTQMMYWHDMKGHCGEYKRDRVYRYLKKTYPDTHHALLALAIEVVYWETPYG